MFRAILLAAAAAIVACQSSDGPTPEDPAPAAGADLITDAERVNPNTMGGIGEEPNVPEKAFDVFAQAGPKPVLHDVEAVPPAIDDAEGVNPHTMGGLAGPGVLPNEPDPRFEVGAGVREGEEPMLQDTEVAPAEAE